MVTGSLMTKIHYWHRLRNTVLSAAGADGESSEIDDGVKRAFALIESYRLSEPWFFYI